MNKNENKTWDFRQLSVFNYKCRKLEFQNIQYIFLLNKYSTVNIKENCKYDVAH